MDRPNEVVQEHTSYLIIQHTATPPLLPVSSPSIPLFVSKRHVSEWKILSAELEQYL